MRFEKAVVINPPNPPGYVSNKDSMGGFGQLYATGAPPFPPLDIPFLTAYLTERGLASEVIEAGALHLSTEEVCERLRHDPALSRSLVLVRTSLPTIDWDLKVCAEIRRVPQVGGLGLFGPVVPSLLHRVQADPSIDYAILGEPDGTVADLMTDTPLGGVPGLLYREDGGWKQNTERPLERDLDSIPFPRWDMLPYDRYVIPKSSTSGQLRFLPMLSSRGCPYGCSYCPYPIGQGLKWRFRSPGNVVDEMEHLVRDLGVQYILFRDPMFSLQQKRVVTMCEEILKRGLQVKWKCETRVDCLDEPTIEIMARAGCVGVNFGVESTDPEVQKGVHRKPILTEEFLAKVAMCRKNDVATFAFFVVGLPGDTVDTIMNSMAFAVDIRANWTQFTVATPFIGTPMYDWALTRGFVAPGFYEIISAHEGSIGNENLRPRDIQRMHQFAEFLNAHLINRHGILKNELRKELPYRAAKRVLDAVTRTSATLLVDLARFYFHKTITPLPPAPAVRGDTALPPTAGAPQPSI